MEKLSSPLSTTNNVKLKGTIEVDEFYIKAGFKGRAYHNDIIKSGREPRRRALKPWKGRGTFDKDYPMITCIHQRDYRITHFNVPVKQNLVDITCSNVDYGSTVYTDEYVAYNQLKVHGLVHEQVKHSVKEYARGDIHINNCECRSNLFKIWIAKFMGVNKYNLEAYSKAFEFIHNMKGKTHSREERFMQILCHKQLKHSWNKSEVNEPLQVQELQTPKAKRFAGSN